MKSKFLLLVAIGIALRLALVAPSAPAEEAEQEFADEKAYKIEAFNGGANLQVERLKDKGPTGKQAIAIKFDGTRENSGARVVWDFPAEVLDGKTFVLQVRKGKLPYVRAAFLAEGKQVCRLNYFNVGGDKWQAVSFPYGKKGPAASIEPATVPAGQKIDRIMIQLCGKADKSYEVEISAFALAGETGSKPGSKPAPTDTGEPAAVGKALPPSGGKMAGGPAQAFDNGETFAVKPFHGAVNLRVTELEKPGPTGRPALDIVAECPRDNAGVNVEWSFPPRVLDGKTFSLQVTTPNGPIAYVRAEFLDANGKRLVRNNYFSVAASDWRALTLAVRGKTGAASVEPAQPEAGQQVAGIRLQFGGQAGKRVHVVISDFTGAGESGVRRVQPLAADVAPTVAKGDIGIWLDPARAYTLTAVRIGTQRFERPLASTYPSFTFLDGSGKQRTLDADAPGFTVKAETQGEARTAVRYTRDGTTVECVYSVAGDAARCDVNVVEEGDLKLVAVGAGKLVGTELAQGDYGILPNGSLYRRVVGGPPRSFRRLGNADNAVPNFTAAKLGERIFFYKPLTASQEMHVTAETAPPVSPPIEGGDTGGVEMLWFGGQLLFRPSKVKNPATKLCHRTLGWQLETAGDENRDGAVDWVDCGIAYRDRYLKKNQALHPSIRDSLKFYHGVPGDTYEQLAGVIDKMDYCSTLWWVKGAMKTLVEPGSEAHPYTVEADPRRGDRAVFHERYAARGAHVGIYYGHDYLDNTNGDWPAALIKLDENGEPHKYYEHRGHRLLYKDNVRGLATGLLQKHYEQIHRVCGLTRGNPLMLDTFTAYGRQGYHPDFPATPQIETDAKRELCRWFKQQHGLSIAGESVIEGTEDMLDFGAILYNMRPLEQAEFWRKDSWTPLLGVIYHGRTYTGVSVYEFRQPDPNWAASLATGCCLWQWSTGHYPDMYNFGARMFFNQNSAWIPNADADIVDVDRDGTEYRIKFSNGNTLWTDPEKRAWRLEKSGVLYDGFTPFNDRGVMAVLKQGDFDITLPVKEMLEIIPSQPHRAQLDVKIEPTADGSIRVHGNFSKVPWKIKWYHKPEGARSEVVSLRDAAPVLMLRRVGSR